MELVLAKNKASYQTSFIEPVLHITPDGHDNTVEVDFRHQLGTSRDVNEAYTVRFHIPKREFGERIRQLKEEYERFSTREKFE